MILETPISDETIAGLTAGQTVRLSGTVYTARDAAHKRMVEMLRRGEEPPFPFAGQVVFYAGPCPSPPGRVIGSIGPTTSGRMDAYAPELIRCGLKVMIGKGSRSAEVVEAIREYGGVYFAAVGGAAALMSRCVKSAEVVAFDDLGTEAVRRLTVERLPLIVALDSSGNCVYTAPCQ
ncbi:MAG: Fe-S-containing hydro-lyase [Planctomycetaceae bacterium]|nr:Fe-S-containing hydro-lyase [Planctomycetaceae bacterium]